MLELLLNDIEGTEEESDRHIQPIIDELTAVREGRPYASATARTPSARSVSSVNATPTAPVTGISDQDLIRNVAEKAMDEGYRIYEIVIG